MHLPVLNNPESYDLDPGGLGEHFGELSSVSAEGLMAALRGHGRVRTGRHDRMLYATDASMYQVEPLGVVVPVDAEGVERAVSWCAEHDVPVLPRGGGTSLAGQCTNRAVVVDTSASLRRLGTVEEAGEKGVGRLFGRRRGAFPMRSTPSLPGAVRGSFSRPIRRRWRRRASAGVSAITLRVRGRSSTGGRSTVCWRLTRCSAAGRG